jgi:hypothetical protein
VSVGIPDICLFLVWANFIWHQQSTAIFCSRIVPAMFLVPHARLSFSVNVNTLSNRQVTIDAAQPDGQS